MSFLLVAIGGAVGATLRYLLDRWVQHRHESVFPFGTLSANVLGSFVLGALTGLILATPAFVQTLFGVGLCGALTTFSTFGYETMRLFSTRARLYAVSNVLVTVLAGFAAALTGIAFGTLVAT